MYVYYNNVNIIIVILAIIKAPNFFIQNVAACCANDALHYNMP